MRAAPALPLAGEGRGEGSPRVGSLPKPTLAAILPEPLRVAMGFAEDDPLPDFIARVSGLGRPEGAAGNARA